MDLTVRRWGLGLFLLSFFVIGLGLAQEDDEALRQEEAEDYYQKWLEQDVVYIITGEEKEVFQNLQTPEEKEQFIEQFWFRRDPDPRTAENEYKEEHYRRIAYANEMFASGIKGWQTDRGKIYIIHGPPDEIQSRPSGGPYHRPVEEGGGTTVTFPFETWRYRHIPGIGSDVVLEFNDRTQSGEYRLSLTPDEKDVLLHVPGAGLTLSEEYGFTRKEDRLNFSPWKRFEYRGPFNYYRDPFEQYERFVNIKKPAQIQYTDLQQLVGVDISYDALPFKVQKDYLKLNDSQVLTALTIQIDNKELTFEEEYGIETAKVAIYGVVTSLGNRLAEEFDDDLAVSFQPEDLERGRQGRSVYQKLLALDRRTRYKMTLVIKDTLSDKVGTVSEAIIPPAYGGETLKASSLILAEKMHQLEEIPNQEQMFVLGDFYVRPSMGNSFTGQSPINAYLQLYNVGYDQTTQQPSLEIIYRIIKDGETVLEFPDTIGKSVQYFSGQRVVVAAGFPIDDLGPGRYSFSVEVTDRISNEELHLTDQFEVRSESRSLSPSG